MNCAGRDVVRVGIAEHRHRGGSDCVVPGGQELRVLCSVSVPVLRPAAAGRDPGASLETQHHGLCYAVHDTSHEGVHHQGTRFCHVSDPQFPHSFLPSDWFSLALWKLVMNHAIDHRKKFNN